MLEGRERPTSDRGHIDRTEIPDPRVWVCVPTYNEAENLERLVQSLLHVFDETALDGHILVIDDRSPDGTGAIADALARSHSRVHVLHRAEKDGLGRAYLSGFREALAAGADLVVQMDGDLSHDPKMVTELVAAAQKADVALGSRYVPEGRVENWSFMRRIISRAGCWYSRTILSVPIRDLTGGFKCFRRYVLESIPLGSIATAGYGFQIEMTYRALLHGHHVVEVPIVFRERDAGESKMSLAIALEAARTVPVLRLRRRSLEVKPLFHLEVAQPAVESLPR